MASLSHSAVLGNILKLRSVSFSNLIQFLMLAMVVATCSSSVSFGCGFLAGLMLSRPCRSVKNSSLYTLRCSHIRNMRSIFCFTFSSLYKKKMDSDRMLSDQYWLLDHAMLIIFLKSFSCLLRLPNHSGSSL